MNGSIYEQTEYALTLIADGNDCGVDLLYRIAGKNMLFIARNILKDRALAEDAVQESFLKIVKYVSGYKKDSNAYAWICKITRNTALNMLRTRQPHASIDEFSFISSGEDDEEKSTDRILVEKLLSALSPPIVREMIYMKYFLDMTVREIASAVGKSKSYVSKEILKAENTMKTMLHEERKQ